MGDPEECRLPGTPEEKQEVRRPIPPIRVLSMSEVVEEQEQADYHNQPRTVSERNTSSGTSGERPIKHKIHEGLEKWSKDLHRKTVTLERLRMVFNEEADTTYKRINVVFDEMRTCLNNREVDLMSEMDKVKADANKKYARRQNLAADLRVKIDRSATMSDQELSELRADIKHFVSNTNEDEDIGRTTGFLYDSDFLKAKIGRFGEVVPGKTMYSTRQPSVSSVSSCGASQESVSRETALQQVISNHVRAWAPIIESLCETCNPLCGPCGPWTPVVESLTPIVKTFCNAMAPPVEDSRTPLVVTEDKAVQTKDSKINKKEKKKDAWWRIIYRKFTACIRGPRRVHPE